jgi:hypothetical protein
VVLLCDTESGVFRNDVSLPVGITPTVVASEENDVAFAFSNGCSDWQNLLARDVWSFQGVDFDIIRCEDVFTVDEVEAVAFVFVACQILSAQKTSSAEG